MYTEQNLVKIAKRENNTKRGYLVVNRLQGKHMPVKASEAFRMFYQLADQVTAAYPDEKLLIVGFAETATAIGAAVAHRCCMPYMQTTRETMPGVQYLSFSEEHSHAMEQKLVRDDLDRICGDIGRIVFVEDEVTTGKTILNIIGLLEQRYPMIQNYAAASILNGMDGEAAGRYAKKKIGLHYLVKTDHVPYAARAGCCRGDGKYIKCNIGTHIFSGKMKEIHVSTGIQVRRLVQLQEYDNGILKLWKAIQSNINLYEYQNVLIIGTEEFMYPPLRIAEYMEKIVGQAVCHSTTRSPIVVSTEEEYPLHVRYELQSLYDRERRTFLYDIGTYDCVFVVTDAPQTGTEGLLSLVHALGLCGNRQIYVVRWGSS